MYIVLSLQLNIVASSVVGSYAVIFCKYLCDLSLIVILIAIAHIFWHESVVYVCVDVHVFWPLSSSYLNFCGT